MGQPRWARISMITGLTRPGGSSKPIPSVRNCDPLPSRRAGAFIHYPFDPRRHWFVCGLGPHAPEAITGHTAPCYGGGVTARKKLLTELDAPAFVYQNCPFTRELVLSGVQVEKFVVLWMAKLCGALPVTRKRNFPPTSQAGNPIATAGCSQSLPTSPFGSADWWGPCGPARWCLYHCADPVAAIS